VRSVPLPICTAVTVIRRCGGVNIAVQFEDEPQILTDADHTSASSSEVKNGGVIPPLPHMPSWRGALLSLDTTLSLHGEKVCVSQCQGVLCWRERKVLVGHPGLNVRGNAHLGRLDLALDGALTTLEHC
jgi:hypothetical protein